MRELESWVLGYLLNSVWQVPMVFAAAWAISRLARRMGPRAEHRVWVMALAMEAIVPACSLRVRELAAWTLTLLPWVTSSLGKGGAARVTVVTGAGAARGVTWLPPMVLAVIAATYLCGVVYFAARLGWRVWRTRAMERGAKALVLTDTAALNWERCCRVFRVAAAVSTSEEIAGPVTVGFLHCGLLLPTGFMERVGDGDLEAVMAHESAHMQRRDFAKNLLYELVTIMVAYHPLLWWTRSRVAATREMVCDAMAADAVASRGMYARSLLRLASLLAAGTPDRTLHAIGIFDANIFERRVMSLTEKRVEMKGARRIAVACVCVVIGVVTCASAMALRMDVGAPASAVAQDGSDAPLKVPAGVMAGNVLFKKTPVYPEQAKQDKLSGAVVLQVIIGKDGAVEKAVVEKSPGADFSRSAIDAVREWKYKPYLLNGEPVEVNSTITVTYSLRK
jgi:TonB family protein